MTGRREKTRMMLSALHASLVNGVDVDEDIAPVIYRKPRWCHIRSGWVVEADNSAKVCLFDEDKEGAFEFYEQKRREGRVV